LRPRIGRRTAADREFVAAHDLNLLPAREGRPFGLTIHNAASSEHALTVGLRWWSLGILLAVGYFIVAYRFVFFRPEPTLGSERTRPDAR